MSESEARSKLDADEQLIFYDKMKNVIGAVLLFTIFGLFVFYVGYFVDNRQMPGFMSVIFGILGVFFFYNAYSFFRMNQTTYICVTNKRVFGNSVTGNEFSGFGTTTVDVLIPDITGITVSGNSGFKKDLILSTKAGKYIFKSMINPEGASSSVLKLIRG